MCMCKSAQAAYLLGHSGVNRGYFTRCLCSERLSRRLQSRCTPIQVKPPGTQRHFPCLQQKLVAKAGIVFLPRSRDTRLRPPHFGTSSDPDQRGTKISSGPADTVAPWNSEAAQSISRPHGRVKLTTRGLARPGGRSGASRARLRLAAGAATLGLGLLFLASAFRVAQHDLPAVSSHRVTEVAYTAVKTSPAYIAALTLHVRPRL